MECWQMIFHSSIAVSNIIYYYCCCYHVVLGLVSCTFVESTRCQNQEKIMILTTAKIKICLHFMAFTLSANELIISINKYPVQTRFLSEQNCNSINSTVFLSRQLRSSSTKIGSFRTQGLGTVSTVICWIFGLIRKLQGLYLHMETQHKETKTSET